MHSGLHNIKDLLLLGCKKQKLRSHSDLLPNRTANAWALTFSDQFDIQVEAKWKNLAAQQLYEQSLS